jgi:uncharacterized membrane protein YphA (DoxX/SURF4 family)
MQATIQHPRRAAAQRRFDMFRRFEIRAARWLAPHSITLLRVSMGFIFLAFGVLKFVPGLSPAEELARETVNKLTFGLVPGNVGILFVASLESAVGLCLLVGRFMRLGLALLGVAAVGILSPLVLEPQELFVASSSGVAIAPTLAGQYVLKDFVLLAGWLVLIANVLGPRRA